MKKGANRQAFTLIEMSLVLVVIGLIILIVFPALKAVRDGTQRSLTNSNLTTLMRATAAFVQANGCLPCPTRADATGSGFGRVRGDDNYTHPLCGNCTYAEGLPPFASLGLPAATAKDGWGHWITMRIDPYLTTNFAVLPPPAGSGTAGICGADLSKKASAVPITIITPGGATQAAAVLFLSHGPNGWGAYQADPAVGGDVAHPPYYGPVKTCQAASGKGFEACNADGDNAATFYNAPPSDNQDDPFDDIMTFADRNVLVSLLNNGACQTDWPTLPWP